MTDAEREYLEIVGRLSEMEARQRRIERERRLLFHQAVALRYETHQRLHALLTESAVQQSDFGRVPR